MGVTAPAKPLPTIPGMDGLMNVLSKPGSAGPDGRPNMGGLGDMQGFLKQILGQFSQQGGMTMTPGSQPSMMINFMKAFGMDTSGFSGVAADTGKPAPIATALTQEQNLINSGMVTKPVQPGATLGMGGGPS